MTDLLSIFLLVVIGVASGIAVGAIPGLTGAMLIALSLPLTYALDGNSALALLVGMYVGSVSGGLITATLLNMPGTPASVITTLDGHPMAKKGRPGRALGLGIGASLIGGLVSWGLLVLLARPAADMATRLAPFDLFSLVVIALVFIASVSDPGRGGLSRGVLSGMLGCLVALPGLHPATGEPRFTFGLTELGDGLKLLPVLIGMFAMSEVWRSAKRGESGPVDTKRSVRDSMLIPIRTWLGQGWNLLRSSAIGSVIGILPGIGANVGSTIAYGSARSLSREPEVFGTGCDEGVVASESANNATVGGALVPLIALGIPGSVVDAILLGAFVMHGLQPGPLLFANHPETVATITWSYLAANFVMFGLMLGSAKWLSRLATVPKTWLAAPIVVFSVVGSYALGHRMFDVWVMLIFGVVGLLMTRWKIPLAPFVIGFVLTPIAEENLASGLMISGGSYLPLVTRPVSAVCLLVAMVILVGTLRRNRRNEP